MRGMEVKQVPQEENSKMIEMNINQFMEAAREYLFGFMPNAQSVLATIPNSKAR
jgi:hypothetical protein